MVDEAYELLNNKTKITNEQSLDKHEFLDTNLLLPKLDIETTITKLYWKNIQAYLTIINRPDEHFIIFIKNELCNNKINWYSDNKKDGIIIHGRYQKVNTIIELIKKYINLYVICPSCKKKTTELSKLSSKRYQFKCFHCEMTKILL